NGSTASRDDSHACSPIGAFFRGAAGQWEPDVARASRPVLRARGGEIPPRDSPGDRLSAGEGWEEAPRRAERPAITVRSVGARGQDPADRVRAVCCRAPSSCRATSPGDLRLSGLYTLLQQDQKRQVRGQTHDTGQTAGSQAEGDPRGYAGPNAHSGKRAASLATPGTERSLSVLWRHLQLPRATHVHGLCRQALAQDARQTQPKGLCDLGVLQPSPDRLPTP